MPSLLMKKDFGWYFMMPALGSVLNLLTAHSLRDWLLGNLIASAVGTGLFAIGAVGENYFPPFMTNAMKGGTAWCIITSVWLFLVHQ